MLYGKTKTWLGTRANSEPRIFKRKSLELLLLEFGRKNYQGVGETCIFDNPLFHTEFVAYFEKDSKLNFNTGLNPYEKSRKCTFLKAKSLDVVLVVFSFFLHNVVDVPFNYKNPLFHLKKVACECFEIAILVSKLRQIRPFSLLLCRCYGAFMLEWLATVPRYA